MTKKINVKLRKDQLDEVAQKEGERLSVCCNAEMYAHDQCSSCGAEGSHFDEQEKRELIDEKIRDDTNSLSE